MNQDNIGIGILIEAGVMFIHIGSQMLYLGFEIWGEHHGQILGFVQDSKLP